MGFVIRVPDTYIPARCRLWATRLTAVAISANLTSSIRAWGSKGIVRQMINITVDVNRMVSELPRHLDDDHDSEIRRTDRRGIKPELVLT